MMKNKITFDYTYSPFTPAIKQVEIDAIIAKELAHVFWGLYHDGYITDFHLVDEDLNPSTGASYDEGSI